ncbi:MAG: two component transcriptional regulator, AraC family [Clostridiales bacterium]|jgi:two-component system response regulator YesN|nr:two component transcriptional regulator, AraC family [Clostridiales bacterium]
MLTVMIVDDMDYARLELRRLKLWGEKSGFCIVEEAKNGRDALLKLDSKSVDLIITDIKMPKVDGIELLKKIMEKNLCSCIVLLSDYSDFSYVRQGLVLGAFDYLKKPVNEAEFEKLLGRAKEYILSKKKEFERIKQLEEKLEEKVGVYFPKADVNQIIRLIEAGDFKAIIAGENIVHVIWVNSSQDIIKVESVLKSVMCEITKHIFEGYIWLDKFLSISRIENIDFSGCETLEAICKEFSCIIRKITSTIYMLNYSNSGSEIVNQVCNYVLDNVDIQISLGLVADKLHMNKTYISESFKQKTGIGFVEYLTIVKMERAKKLIIEENLKIYEIGTNLGYKDIEYFSRQFKKYTGYTPVEYRQNNTKKDR